MPMECGSPCERCCGTIRRSSAVIIACGIKVNRTDFAMHNDFADMKGFLKP
jgi:hypothetical protein